MPSPSRSISCRPMPSPSLTLSPYSTTQPVASQYMCEHERRDVTPMWHITHSVQPVMASAGAGANTAGCTARRRRMSTDGVSKLPSSTVSYSSYGGDSFTVSTGPTSALSSSPCSYKDTDNDDQPGAFLSEYTVCIFATQLLGK
ncbi:hypothetical protein AZE42_13124 [Rhizopogon vesiculosus]|uniref:Uncharacterized protein n=1 Tax=Rhizopogon vesiculosus TaxID=180088 RepID=A0A1J8QDR3_9AGAM|nr:hypothetical protein AZE42_13124 [Rhizopogon vesiculosus]